MAQIGRLLTLGSRDVVCVGYAFIVDFNVLPSARTGITEQGARCFHLAFRLIRTSEERNQNMQRVRSCKVDQIREENKMMINKTHKII